MSSTRILQDWLDSYIIYTQNSEPAQSYHLWTAISVIAAAMQRKCSLNWGSTLFPNMYIVLVGPSGSRKGTAMSVVMNMLNKLGIKLAAESITREALIRLMKESSSTSVTDDGKRMYLHCSLTVFSEELTVFLGYNQMQLMADMCNWYDCRDSWTYRTKNMGTDEIKGVWFNLIGGTTPALIQTTLPQDAIGGGLTARMIFIYEKGKAKTIVSPHQTYKEQKLGDDLLTDLGQINLMSGEFQISPEFLEAWSIWYPAQDANPPFKDERFGGYVTRRGTHVLKLCMILNASRIDGNMLLEPKDLYRAIQILEIAEEKMPMTFAGVGKSKVSDMVTKLIGVLADEKEVKLSEIMTRFYYDADASSMNLVLNTLNQMGCVKTIVKGQDTWLKYIKGISSEQAKSAIDKFKMPNSD
jgi:hypothetical protein